MSLEIQYKKMKVTELSKMCKERGLKKSGTKGELIERLTNNKREKHPLYSKKINELKDMCKQHSLKVNGNKNELIDRLYNNLYCNNNNNTIIQQNDSKIDISTDDYILLFIQNMITIQTNICK